MRQTAIQITLQQIANVRAAIIADGATDDDRLWDDAIEGMTDAHDVARALLNAMEAEEGNSAVLAKQIADREARQTAAKARHARLKTGLVMLVKETGTLKLPEATVSKTTVPAKLAVNDPEAVPADYCVTTSKPSMDKIKADFSADTPTLPNWLRIEPARPNVTVRRA